MKQKNQTTRVDNTGQAAVDSDYYWIPIDSSTPRGCKLQLINKQAGVAMYGVLSYSDNFFSHWCPLPKFKE